MNDIHIRKEGRAGRITLTRPQALNALSWDMCRAVDAALVGWAADPDVSLVMIDAEGTRAFCAGGDVVEMYAEGSRGNWTYGRSFWRDEYRMNARIAEYPKPTVAFLHGFVMGGGVGLGGHAGLRIVAEDAQVAMPECGIGLVPDVGGTMLLARAPGRLGAYLGLTGARMGPADAMLCGFADVFVPRAEWDTVKAAMVETGSPEVTGRPCAEPARLAAARAEIDAFFAPGDLPGIVARLMADPGPLAAETLKALSRNSPLSMAATLAMLHRLGPEPDIRAALRQEYRFTWRAQEHSDFLEGIRAQIIDKDRTPRWRHALGGVPEAEVEAMLAPLGTEELTF